MSEQDYEATVRVSASVDEVFDALTTLEGLSSWWTPATGQATAGGELTFTFGPQATAVMRVDMAERGVGVRWTNTECVVEDWVGTEQDFAIDALSDGGTEIRFRHIGLTPQLECYGDCESGWNHFVASLAAYVETGTGYPNGSPQDAARREEYASRVAAGVA
jgi:uncharacterized protein YndB with AHSA1/START domain